MRISRGRFGSNKKTLKEIMDNGTDYEFRTTFLKTWHTDEIVNEMGNMIKGAKAFYIQNFRAGKTLDPNMTEEDTMTQEDLERIKKIMEKYVQKVEIR